MNSILKSFFYRTFKTKGFWIQFAILGTIGLLIGIGIVLAANGFRYNYENAEDPMVRTAYYAEYQVLNFRDMSLIGINGGLLSASASLPHIPLCVITILFSIRFHAEYSSGSMRNYIVSGYSRQQAYRSLFFGFLVYCAALYAAYAFSMVAVLGIGQLYGGFDGAADVGEYFACIGLSFLCYVAYYAFAYFLNTAMGGRGFAGPLCLMIYVVLAIVAALMTTFFALGQLTIYYESNYDEEAVKNVANALRVIFSFFPSGHGTILGSGHLSTAAFSAFNFTEDFTLPNVIIIILENAGLGIGTFFLGQAIIAHRDLK